MTKLKVFIKNRDYELLYFFNRKIQKDYLDPIMVMITHIGSFGFAFFLSLLLIISVNQTVRTLGFNLVLGLILSSSFVFFIKTSIKRPRPFENFESVRAVLVPKDKNSFPSGHTCAAMTMGMTISQSLTSINSILVITVSILVGISRIYLGVHYPSDVLFGIIIAFLTVVALVPILI